MMTSVTSGAHYGIGEDTDLFVQPERPARRGRSCPGDVAGAGR
jgi:hypothetical protein